MRPPNSRVLTLDFSAFYIIVIKLEKQSKRNDHFFYLFVSAIIYVYPFVYFPHTLSAKSILLLNYMYTILKY